MLLDLTKHNFDEFILKNDLVLIEFYAKWCQNCLQLEYILEDILDDYLGDIYIYKVNVENEEELSQKFEVYNLPTLILFENGKIKKTMINLQSKNKILEWLEI